MEAAPREVQSQNLVQSEERADNPLGEPQGHGTVGSLIHRTVESLVQRSSAVLSLNNQSCKSCHVVPDKEALQDAQG